jgi:hypothetical protein
MRQGTTSEAAEKGLPPREKPEKRTSVAKATAEFIALTPGINPRPTTPLSFSATCSVVPQMTHPDSGFSRCRPANN